MTEGENNMRILATGVPYTPPQRDADPSQTSLTLDPAVICTGFESDGQSNITSPGQGLFLVLLNTKYDLIRSTL